MKQYSTTQHQQQPQSSLAVHSGGATQAQRYPHQKQTSMSSTPYLVGSKAAKPLQQMLINTQFVGQQHAAQAPTSHFEQTQSTPALHPRAAAHGQTATTQHKASSSQPSTFEAGKMRQSHVFAPEHFYQGQKAASSKGGKATQRTAKTPSDGTQNTGLLQHHFQPQANKENTSKNQSGLRSQSSGNSAGQPQLTLMKMSKFQTQHAANKQMLEQANAKVFTMKQQEQPGRKSEQAEQQQHTNKRMKHSTLDTTMMFPQQQQPPQQQYTKQELAAVLAAKKNQMIKRASSKTSTQATLQVPNTQTSAEHMFKRRQAASQNLGHQSGQVSHRSTHHPSNTAAAVQMLNSGNASTVATTTAGQADSTANGNSAVSGSNGTKQLVMTQSGQDSKSKEKGAQQVSSFVAISNQKQASQKLPAPQAPQLTHADQPDEQPIAQAIKASAIVKPITSNTMINKLLTDRFKPVQISKRQLQKQGPGSREPTKHERLQSNGQPIAEQSAQSQIQNALFIKRSRTSERNGLGTQQPSKSTVQVDANKQLKQNDSQGCLQMIQGKSKAACGQLPSSRSSASAPNQCLPQTHTTDSKSTITVIPSDEPVAVVAQQRRDERKKALQRNLEVCDLLDLRNVQTVAEHAPKITTFLLSEEKRHRLPESFMSHQVQRFVSEKNRATLVDYLAELHYKFKMWPETLFVAIGIVDRFLSLSFDFEKEDLQCLGITAFHIAGKYEEIYPPDLKTILKFTNHVSSASEVLQMEFQVLMTLQYEVTFPSIYRFIERFARLAQMNERQIMLATYIAETALLDCSLAKELPSKVAACCIYSVQSVYKSARATSAQPKGALWNSTLSKHSTYRESDLNQMACQLIKFVQKVERSTYLTMYKKYMNPRFGEVAKLLQNHQLPQTYRQD